MDLLRRHIDALAQELREIGYEDVSFDFAQNGHAQDGAQDGEGNALGVENSFSESEGSPLAPSADLNPNLARLALSPGGGIDIRL